MERRTEWLVAAPVMILGLALRLAEAARSYLNPDEIQYFFFALPGSFKELFLSGRLTDHPPLLFFLLHPIASHTSSEIALRSIPVLAGTIFPWAVYRWLARVWTASAGLIALVVLTFSPNLISLSAQVRGYTLELLFAALALLFLDIVLEDDSLRAMVLFIVSLDLAILSEYSAIWFAGAVGIYFLLRAMHGSGTERKVSPRLWIVWAVGQVSALMLCGALYWISIRPRLALRGGDIDDYLSDAFPAAHQSPLAFGASATLKQFAYAVSSYPVGIGAAILFTAALVILWQGRASIERARDRIFVALLVVPFVLACAGALLKLHPYGGSRHTVILALFAAAGVGIALERILRSQPWIAGFAAVTLGLIWLLAAEPDPGNIARSRDRRTSMIAGVNYLLSSIPPGSVVLADKEAALFLRFYARGVYDADKRELDLRDDFDSAEALPVGAFRVTWQRWDFGEVDDFLDDLAAVRSGFGLKPDAPVWVVDGGFSNGIDARLRQRYPGISLPGHRDFDGALTVFQTPPGI